MQGVDSDTVLWEIDDVGVLTLTLNRPERNNGWTLELEGALHGLLEQAAESGSVRAIVLTGAGKAFCPGLDTAELDRVSKPGESFARGERRPMQMPSYVPKPVVAAINGACAGLGLITALFSDIRFAAAEAKLTTAFVSRGLPAEEAVSWILPRIVGHAVALDLLLSGRVVTGAEAAELGLVHRSYPSDELLPAALDYARMLATKSSPTAMAAVKAQVYADWEGSHADSRRVARALVGELKELTGDFREGVTSFMERRPAQFEPLVRPVDHSTMRGAADA